MLGLDPGGPAAATQATLECILLSSIFELFHLFTYSKQSISHCSILIVSGIITPLTLMIAKHWHLKTDVVVRVSSQ